MMKPPQNQFSFAPAGTEANYLYDKISYWWYIRHNRNRALAFSRRLFEKFLASEEKDDVSIAVQSHFALFFEVRGDLANAILHKRREIASLRKVIRWGTSLPGGYVLPSDWPVEDLGVPKGCDYLGLANSLCRLASLLNQSKKSKLARKAWEEALTLAQRYGFQLQDDATRPLAHFDYGSSPWAFMVATRQEGMRDG
jgi:hypothetical protein